MKGRRRNGDSAGPAAGGSAGLTLLEVLLAVALLGLGMAVIVQGFAVGLRVRRESAAIREMTLAASGAVNLLLARGEAPAEEEEGEAGSYFWRIIPEAVDPPEDGESELVQVRILVERRSGRPLQVLTLFPAAGEE